MKTPPLLKYSGLAIVMSNPSRFDIRNNKLLSAQAHELVAKRLLPIPLQACYICTVEEALLPGTRVVMCLGNTAKEMFFDSELTLNQLRGTPKTVDGITYICSYLPQDALDMKASYEKDNNPWLVKYEESKIDGDDDVKSTKGRTKRENFAFWLGRDLEKARRYIKGEIIIHPEMIVELYPDIEIIEQACSSLIHSEIHLDIETEHELKITVLTISFNDENIYYTIPLYSTVTKGICFLPLGQARLLRALAIAFSRMLVVVFNCMFDLLILAEYYKIPPPRKMYDPMLVHSRLFPGTEKSLGHGISLYTNLPYHKNEGVYEPHNRHQEDMLWAYNAKDVYGMKEVKKGQQAWIKKLKAEESVKQVNDGIYSYLLMTIHGQRVDEVTIRDNIAKNQRRMVQMQRIVNALAGHKVLPTSNKATVNYFHNELKLKVVKRSKKTKKPSLDAEAFYQLYIRNDLAIIPVCLEYRRLVKETSSLNFVIWRKD